MKGDAGTPRAFMVERVAGGVPIRRNRVHRRTTREDFNAERQFAGAADCENETEETVMVERYPDPSVEDPQLYRKLLTLPGDQVNWKTFLPGDQVNWKTIVLTLLSITVVALTLKPI